MGTPSHLPRPGALPPPHPHTDPVPSPSLAAEQPGRFANQTHPQHIPSNGKRSSECPWRAGISPEKGRDVPGGSWRDWTAGLGAHTGTGGDWCTTEAQRWWVPKPLQPVALRTRSSQDESCDWNFKSSPKEFQHFQPFLLPQGCPDRACFTNTGCTHPSSSASPLVCPHLRCGTRNQCQLPKSHLPDSPWPPWQREPRLKDPLLPCHRPQGQKGDRDSDVPPIAPSPEMTQKIMS